MTIQYSLGQRCVSEAEPDLGLGTITACSPRTVEITFATHATVRTYAARSAPLTRIVFKPGQRIRDGAGRDIVVSSAKTDEVSGLVTYIGKDGYALREDQVGDTVDVSAPEQRLLHGLVDRSEDFDMRAEILQLQARIQSSEVRGFAGGRIDLLPHQLFIACTVAGRRIPRVLLSDETGLGKTIEACLIVHRLILTGRASRVLILVPDSLVHQWFVELLRRFNLNFRIFSPEFCADAGNANPFLADQQGICSINHLCSEKGLSLRAVEAGWDMVVVDEAHHLHADTPGYALVKELSEHTAGIMLLTATPEQLGRRSHFARLKLLDPHRYSNYERYEAESRRLRNLSQRIDQTLVELGVDSATLDPDAVIMPAHATQLAGFDGASNEGVLPLSQFIDRYGMSRVIFRNTRRVISGFPSRIVHMEPIDADEAARTRVREEHLRDRAPGPLPALKPMAAQDPRIGWLIGLVRQLRAEKALVMCTTQEKVLGVQQAVQSNIKLDIAVFHEGMTLIQRDRNAAWFAENAGAPMLVCSETGSEGRNFQFCHHLVLFDVPCEPELLEQRIGRLDRIGQHSAIHIHVPYVKGSAQEVVCRWYHEGLGAFAVHVPSAGRVYEVVRSRLDELAANPPREPRSDERLDSLLRHSRSLCMRFSERLLAARDRLLELSSFQPRAAERVVQSIAAADRDDAVPRVMARLFKHYGIAMEDGGPGRLILLTEYVTTPAFPLPRRERPTVTYDRGVALAREDIEFLTIDHPTVWGALELHLSSDNGTSAFAVWEDRGARELICEAVYVVECVAPARLFASRFLPSTPIRVAVNHAGLDVTPLLQRMPPLSNAPIDRLLSNHKLSHETIPAMLGKAQVIAQARAEATVEAAMAAMRALLDKEIARLTDLEGRGGDARSVKAEIGLCTTEREELATHIGAARLRLDSIRVIWRGAPPQA